MEEQMNVQAAAGSKKWLWLAVAAAAVLAALWWWGWQRPREAVAPEIGEPALSAQDTTSAIEQELQATDLGNIEQEFQNVEQELQGL